MTLPKKRRPKPVVPRFPRTIGGDPVDDLDRELLAPSPQVVGWLRASLQALRGQLSVAEGNALHSDIANWLAARDITDDIIAGEAELRRMRARGRARPKKTSPPPRARARKTR